MQIDRESSNFGHMFVGGVAFALGSLAVAWMVRSLARADEDDEDEDDDRDP
jgi:hypothetical protein